MNKLEKNKLGFTMIELMAVIVIVGILAAIGMPAMWSQMARQEGQEAINTMNMMRSAMESCGVANNGDLSNCTWDAINMANPQDAAGAKFDYDWPARGSDGTYTMTATSKTGRGVITLWKDSSGMNCTATGSYRGLC